MLIDQNPFPFKETERKKKKMKQKTLQFDFICFFESIFLIYFEKFDFLFCFGRMLL